MEAKEKEILNEFIAGTKCQFVIPVFQRNYDWRIKDCDRLFDDIVELAKDKEHADRKHFIGAFVCKFNKFVDTSFNQFVLIDGQQRLTSITLILKALYDYIAKFGNKYDELRAEIKETYLINKFAKDQNLRLKLKPNQLDNDNFNKLMDDEEIDQNSTIGRNYYEFYKKLENMDVSIDDFYNAIQRLEGVAVYLDENDNPQVIFESLNSTGLELTDVDLIRNYLLMNCKATQQDDFYKKYWLKIENELGEFFLQFIKDYLTLKNGIVTSSSKNYVYTAFQKFYRSNNYDKEEFLKEFCRLSKIYNRLFKPTADSPALKEALMDYSSLDIKTSYPFVFGLLIDNEPNEKGIKNISDENLIKILRLLESYLVRRNVCNLSGGGLSQVMASLYNNMRKKFGDKFYKDPVSKVSMALVGISSKAYFPKNEEFIREFKTRDMYHNKNVFYILKKMELNHQEKEVIDFDSLTIEHVMPQTLSNEWVKYLNREDWMEFHNNYVNRIGNLTLTAYNSEMSNKLYEEKKEHTDFSRLVLNTYFKDKNNWKCENDIDLRANELSDIAIAIWPYPEVTNIEDIATESHFLLDDTDDYDYAGTNPAGIEIKDYKLVSESWVSLYIDVLKFLYEQNKTLFISLFDKENYFNSDKRLLCEKNVFRAGFKITDKLYTETNFNTERKIKNLKTIFRDYQYEEDDVIIFIK